MLFLDEPTTGLDPRGRVGMWDVIEDLVRGGTTLLLTTQYLEEADRLAREIVVVDHGRVIARGDARTLKRQVGGDQLLVVPAGADDLPRAAELLERVTGAVPAVEPAARRATAPTEDGVAAIRALAADLQAAGIAVDDVGLRQPTLDDVFLTLTGSRAEREPAGDEREPEEALR